MAIVQISKIQNRRGLNQDLPQLAGGELGWSIDSRQLYIGNGTLGEGAPVEGHTEILTEFSIINFTAGFASQVNTLAGNVTVLEGNIVTINSQIATLQQGTISNVAATLPISSGAVTASSLSNGSFNYTVTQGTAQRTGRINFNYNSSTSTVSYDEEYTQVGTTNLVFTLTANSTATSINYNTTGSAVASALYYIIQSV